MTTPTQLTVQPMQWTSIKDLRDVAPLSAHDTQLLLELREVLIKHDAVDRFGVTLIHKHFDLAENEDMVEFTDPETRTLIIRPLADASQLKMIETSWKFSRNDSGGTPLINCNTWCHDRCPNKADTSVDTRANAAGPWE